MTSISARPRLDLALGWLLSLALAASAADAPPTPTPAPVRTPAPAPAPADSVQDLLFIGGPPPILIRMHLRVGDRPLEVAWREAVGKLHAHLDTDGDGTLTRAEADRLEWARVFRPIPGPARSIAARDLAARSPDDVTSIEGLAAFVRPLLNPLSIESRPPFAPQQDTTFARLDADGDGALGRDELARCPEAFRPLDQNDDETVSLAEQAPFPYLAPAVALRAPGVNANNAGPPPLVPLKQGPPRDRLMAQIFNRLDTGGADGAKPGDQRLSRAEIGLTEEPFDAADGDGDGALDGDELNAYLDGLRPSVELIVRLGPGPVVKGRDRVEVVERPDGEHPDVPPVQVRRVDDSLTTLDLGNYSIDLRTDDMSGDRTRSRQIIRALFMTLARGEGNTIGKDEVRGREPFQSLFSLMDRDGDGRVVEAEMNAAIDLLDGLSSHRAILGVADRGGSLFGALDANSDGRLGPREQQAALGRLAPYDRDGDGRITAGEIPRRFDWVVSPAPMPIGVATAAVNRAVAQQVAPARPSEGPPWFAKMDRNRDGDLSLREFLGPGDVFRRLDADGNGLIDAREASAADTP